MPELIPISFFMCVAAIAVLRPISKKLGLLLEAMARERQVPQVQKLDDRYLARMTQVLEQLNTRMELIEDRLEFVERLSDGRPQKRVASVLNG